MDHHATKQALLGFENGLLTVTDPPTVSTREIIKISREFTEITDLSYGARAPLELIPRAEWLKHMRSTPTKPPVLPTRRRENKTLIVETDENGKEVVIENDHDEVIVIAEDQNSGASSSSSGDIVDVIDKHETSNIQVDEIDTNRCGETSEVTSNEIPEGKNEEAPQEFDSTGDVKHMTKTPEQQQLSDAPEPAVQVVDDQDDGTVEQAGDEPAKEEPAVQLHEALLDETQPVVQSPREDHISRAVRLELERLPFEKKARHRFRRARARSPNRAPL